MTFVDTNYFLRFLLRDIDPQHKEAKDLFLKAAKGEGSFVSSAVVFFEVFWVLHSTYKQDKNALIEKIKMILQLNIVFEQHQLLVNAIKLFSKLNLSLEDCYNLTYSQANNIKSLATFDKDLLRAFTKSYPD